MKTEYITVAEFAQQAGVSRQAVYSRLDSQELSKYIQVDNTGSQPKKLLSTEALPLFKKGTSKQVNESRQSTSDSFTDFLQAQIREKDKTIEALLQQTKTLQEQNQELTRLLDQGQQLQAMSQKLLAQPEKAEPEDIQDVARAEPEQEKKTFFSRWFRW